MDSVSARSASSTNSRRDGADPSQVKRTRVWLAQLATSAPGAGPPGGGALAGEACGASPRIHRDSHVEKTVSEMFTSRARLCISSEVNGRPSTNTPSRLPSSG